METVADRLRTQAKKIKATPNRLAEEHPQEEALVRETVMELRRAMVEAGLDPLDPVVGMTLDTFCALASRKAQERIPIRVAQAMMTGRDMSDAIIAANSSAWSHTAVAAAYYIGETFGGEE